MKLYTKRTFLASIMFVLAAFSFATNFCSVSLSDSEQNSLSERVKLGGIAGAIEGIETGTKLYVAVMILCAVIGVAHEGREVYVPKVIEAIKKTGAVESVKDIVIYAAKQAAFGGAMGVVASLISDVEVVQKKAKSTARWNAFGALAGCFLAANRKDSMLALFKVGGRLIGGMIGYLKA